jgi:hypothetical protein
MRPQPEPRVPNLLIDRANNITYRILAYKVLNEWEKRQAVRIHLIGRQRPRKNSVVEIRQVPGTSLPG